MQLTTNGIVLSVNKTGDDRILTVLTAHSGVITAYANGANRIKTRLNASTELLSYSRFVVFQSRGRNVVDSADSLHIFFGIREDIEKLALASYFAELAKELSPAKERADIQLSVILNSLHFLENGKRDNRMLKPLMELRLLTLSGYMPSLVSCRECACFEAAEMWFSPLNGDLACGSCAKEEDKHTCMYISAGVLAAMRHIIYSPPEKLFSFTLSPEGFDMLNRVSERFFKMQLEKTLPTLEFYKNLH